jgi:hypothetical protein
MSRATETAKGGADTASLRAAEAARRIWKAGEFGAQRPRGGPLRGPGKFFRRTGWRRHLRDLALTETSGAGPAKPRDKGD